MPVFHIGLPTSSKVPNFSHDLVLSGGLSAVWNVVLEWLQLILRTPPKSHPLSEVFVEFPTSPLPI